ncbi:MAG: B12-binding domain-containing radical SAM protein [Candidatus Omnitrophica bacterium]|nr:B12-binding domain-containing radical SAM protein [Candidatus Omnitrophota bacterium]
MDEKFCLAPPLSLAYVAAILERAGHRVIMVDANALGLSKADTAGILDKFKPDILAFRMDAYQFHQTLEWIRYLKQKIAVPVIAGGINFLNYARESLSYKEIDYGIVGEAVESLPKLVLAIQNKEEISGIEGAAYRNEYGDIVINPAGRENIGFDLYPFPARHLLPNEKYYSFVSQAKNFTIMVTSKGCPYKCKFCAIAKLPYLERSPENVVQEIEECYKKFNIREIDIFDAVFFLNKKRVFDICEKIIKRNIKIKWTCRSRVDLVDEELLKLAASAGCRCIFYGIESADQRILNAINKEINLRQVEQAIKLSKKHGIQTLGFFMLGNPGETKDTIRRTVSFAKRLSLDFVQIGRTIAKPGSDLHAVLQKETRRDFWREYILGEQKEDYLPAPWTNLSVKEMNSYVKKAYRSFYFRPGYIAGRIFKIKSFGELARYLIAGVKFIFCNS